MLVTFYCPHNISPPSTPPSLAIGIISQGSEEQLPIAFLKATARQVNVSVFHFKCWALTALESYLLTQKRERWTSAVSHRLCLLWSRNRSSVLLGKQEMVLTQHLLSELYEVPRHQTLKWQGDCAGEKKNNEKKQEPSQVISRAVLNVSDPEIWTVSVNEPKCLGFTSKGLQISNQWQLPHFAQHFNSLVSVNCLEFYLWFWLFIFPEF